MTLVRIAPAIAIQTLTNAVNPTIPKPTAVKILLSLATPPIVNPIPANAIPHNIIANTGKHLS